MARPLQMPMFKIGDYLMKCLGWLILLGVGSSSSLLARELIGIEYRLLATGRTSTMERELNEAARDGFVLERAMGGETAHGGRESMTGRSSPLHFLPWAYKKSLRHSRHQNQRGDWMSWQSR